MNEEKRHRLRDAISMIEKGASVVESVKDDEQDSFDNMPENLQESDRGIAMEDAIGELEDAFSSAKDAIDSIERAMYGNS